MVKPRSRPSTTRVPARSKRCPRCLHQRHELVHPDRDYCHLTQRGAYYVYCATLLHGCNAFAAKGR